MASGLRDDHRCHKMTTNTEEQEHTLAPPAVTALRQGDPGSRVAMQRTNTSDMRAERDDLKAAAEQSLNVILDLALDGTIRWVSSSWTDVVGTPVDSVIGKPIADFMVSNKDGFAIALESMKKDDSKSRIIRFQVQLGDMSVLRQTSSKNEEQPEGDNAGEDETATEDDQVLNLEGQGIVIYDRSSGDDSHVCCMIV